MKQSSRHIVVVAYEFPPAAGPGVQRIVAFIKYLTRAGWRVSVVCAEPVPSQPRDESMLADVVAARVTTLPARHVATAIARAMAPLKRRGVRADGISSNTLSATSVSRNEAKSPLSTRLSRWLAVPDDAAWWRASAEAAIARINASDPIDVVFASGPPYSAIVAGVNAAQRLSVPVVVDLRDPWRDNAALRWPTALHRLRSDRLERRALESASAVTAVSEPIATEAREMGAAEAMVLPNGYDPERVPVWNPDPSTPLTIAFMGRFSNILTNPTPFFAGLALASERSIEAARVRVVVVGPEYDWVRDVIAEWGLTDRVEILGYQPNAAALALVAAADVGLIVLAELRGTKAIYSSKLFDYLGISIPVLLVGPADCAAADILREANAGIVAVPDEESVAGAIIGLAEAKAAGTLAPRPIADVVARFSRESQAAELSALLDRVIGLAR